MKLHSGQWSNSIVAVETVTLLDLGPIIAALLGPMLAFVAVSMRYQHNDSTKTRELISESNRENRQLIERASRENRELVERATDKLSAELADHRQLSERRHQEVVRSLGEARERLARIEGHLGTGTHPPHENETGEESGKAA